MATIDLIVLGMLRKESLSAYDIQKLVEYRNISKWVKISTPSIYKKVIQLEEKGLISSRTEKEGKMPEKAVYSLTDAGKEEFEKLMIEISCKPINIFLDFNAVIVNLESMSKESQKECLDNIESSMNVLKTYLEENIARKENASDIPITGMAVLRSSFFWRRQSRNGLQRLKKMDRVIPMTKTEWIRCSICGNKTRLQDMGTHRCRADEFVSNHSLSALFFIQNERGNINREIIRCNMMLEQTRKCLKQQGRR